jgi:hypothetical protein
MKTLRQKTVVKISPEDLGALYDELDALKAKLNAPPVIRLRNGRWLSVDPECYIVVEHIKPPVVRYRDTSGQVQRVALADIDRIQPKGQQQ